VLQISNLDGSGTSQQQATSLNTEQLNKKAFELSQILG